MTEQLAAGAEGQIQYTAYRANAEVAGKNPKRSCAFAGKADSVGPPAAARGEDRRQPIAGLPRIGTGV